MTRITHKLTGIFRYGAYGISIRSQLPLPLPAAAGSTFFEVEIQAHARPLRESLPRELPLQWSPSSSCQFCELPDGSAYVQWQNVGEALISANGREILCHSFPESTAESFNVYVLGQALSFALVRGGFEPLHATAVVIEDRAVAFLGDCGFGKSTLAAAFLQAGHRLLTDDLLVLRESSDGIVAFPGPPRIKLFPEIASSLLGNACSGVPMNPVAQKLIIPLEERHAVGGAVPLHRIYALDAPRIVDGPTEVQIASLTPREAFVTLVGSTFNSVISDPARLRRQFESAQTLANSNLAKKLAYPRSLKHLELVRQAVVSDVVGRESEVCTCIT